MIKSEVYLLFIYLFNFLGGSPTLVMIECKGSGTLLIRLFIKDKDRHICK